LALRAFNLMEERNRENSNNMTKPDEELMTDYRMGNIDALEELFQRYKKRLLNYALRLLGNLADAEDVVGEAFYAVTAQKDKYEVRAKFSTWLYTIAHNSCVDRIRKRRKIVFLWFKKEAEDSEYEELEIPDTKYSPDAEAQDNERAAIVKKAIEKLPYEYREAVILREYQQLNYEEIAGILNCSLAKVKVLIFRGREKLRKELMLVMGELR